MNFFQTDTIIALVGGWRGVSPDCLCCHGSLLLPPSLGLSFQLLSQRRELSLHGKCILPICIVLCLNVLLAVRDSRVHYSTVEYSTIHFCIIIQRSLPHLKWRVFSYRCRAARLLQWTGKGNQWSLRCTHTHARAHTHTHTHTTALPTCHLTSLAHAGTHI